MLLLLQHLAWTADIADVWVAFSQGQIAAIIYDAALQPIISIPAATPAVKCGHEWELTPCVSAPIQ